MRKTIPVIRAAGMIPLLRYLIQRRHPVEAILRANGIGYVWVEDPSAPIPVKALETIVLIAVDLEGPDVGCRSVTEQALQDLAALGSLVLSAATARQALVRVGLALPFHCSHELIHLTPGDPNAVLQESWMVAMDPAAMHVVQQTVAAMVQVVLRMASTEDVPFRKISLVPHPRFGLDHLKPYLAGEIVPASRPVLHLTIPNTVLDAPFRHPPQTPPQDRNAHEFPWQRLHDGTLSGSARFLVRAMLRDGAPTIERVSAAAGMSVRTIQRRFAEEGTTYSDLVEDVRRTAAMDAIAQPGRPIGDVAADLGYSGQSSLTRAVRRWTGAPPTALRTGRNAAE